ncbi:MAG: matrixin family metalloprotease, partial [Planctomycetota bacterium]|nr:matrixin family metalloprotease [Planctomycetota bacterium]
DLTPPEGGDYIAANFHWVQGSNMVESDIVFNDANYTWWNGSGYCSYMMDIWNIATHELGHTLCLADLYSGGDSQKTMYGYASHCETKKRTLHQDDINGIVAIYGVVTPENDRCYAGLVAYEGEYPFSNINATTDGPDEPNLCTFDGYSHIESDVWFRYWPGCTGQATVDVCESDYDTKIAVYEAVCPTGPDQAIACDDDGCNPQSIMTFPVVEETFYYIRIGGYYGAEGSGTMVISCEPDEQCPADFDGDGDVDTADLLYLLAAWGTPDGDVDGDGDTDTADLLALLADWGDCP